MDAWWRAVGRAHVLLFKSLDERSVLSWLTWLLRVPCRLGLLLWVSCTFVWRQHYLFIVLDLVQILCFLTLFSVWVASTILPLLSLTEVSESNKIFRCKWFPDFVLTGKHVSGGVYIQVHDQCASPPHTIRQRVHCNVIKKVLQHFEWRR